jgi:hypothetical protein
MPTHKKRHRKGTSKKVYQVGCAKRRTKTQRVPCKKMTIKGGNPSPFGPTTFLSRTMYPYDSTGGAPNPADARQTGGRKRRRYSRKYYKQAGGATFFDKLMTNHADQPINEKYTATNQFRV